MANALSRPTDRERAKMAGLLRMTTHPTQMILIPLKLPDGREKEKQTARASRLLFAVCSVLYRLKTDDHAAALGIVAAKACAGKDLDIRFGKTLA